MIRLTRIATLAILMVLFPIRGNTQQESAQDDPQFLPGIDVSLDSCLDFANAATHLENIWSVENNSALTSENRDENAVQDFIWWYRETGHRRLQESGNKCIAEMDTSYGGLGELRAQTYVMTLEKVHADFALREIITKCGIWNLFPNDQTKQ